MESYPLAFGNVATVQGWLGFGQCGVQEEVIAHIMDMEPDKVMLVTDEQVNSLHGDYFDSIEAKSCDGETGSESAPAVKLEKFVLPNGDACKSWDNLKALVDWSFESGATKHSVVVGFGGGALLNVTGLYASMVYRGMRLVYVPTTFLAMHDVVTSIKTSICHMGQKNNIGTFYAPNKILIDTSFCRTLPTAELFSGLGELCKNAALFGGEHYDGFVEALSKDSDEKSNGGSGEEFSMSRKTLVGLVRLGIKAKMDLLAEDAHEKKHGMVFEYGHTMSHAIEKAYGDGTVPHGLGVVYGMTACSYVAEKIGLMSSKERQRHDELCDMLLRHYPLPQPMPTVQQVMDNAMKDNKRGITQEAADEISDILLTKIGEILPTSRSNLSKFPSQYFQEWLVAKGFQEEQGCCVRGR
ncbi:3-dehydroquinate synthase [Amphidinium carterae]